MKEIKKITSSQNASIKLLRSLDMRKARQEHGLFVAEGVKIVLMAKEQGWVPEAIFFEENTNQPGSLIHEILVWGQKAQAECLEISRDLLSKFSTKDNPQSVIAVFKQKWSSPAELAKSSTLVVALEEVRDPGNLGTIIRTMDAVNANGLLLCGNCCDPYSRESVRASMGSIFSMPLIRLTPQEFAAFVVDWEGESVGTHLSEKTVDFRRTYAAPTLLIMGSEGPGLSDSIAQKCKTLVKIPMQGHADSLNLGTATGVMLYEIRRTNKTHS